MHAGRRAPDNQMREPELTAHLFASDVWQPERLAVDPRYESRFDPQTHQILDVKGLTVDQGVQQGDSHNQSHVEVTLPV